ncbi:hypothetical protein BIU90_12515 [Curtobacterium sp. MCBA15_001]|nr:hypothetical protein BIU90_12515 [Curtobacterium sp. MCBA15_001]
MMTAGLAEAVPGGLARQEILVTVHPLQWEAARILVSATTSTILERGRGLIRGDVVTSDEPLLAGTEIGGVLAAVNPYLPEESSNRPSETGGVETEFMSLIPLTVAEGSWLAASPEADLGARQVRLLELLDDESVDLLDVRRTSVLTPLP